VALGGESDYPPRTVGHSSNGVQWGVYLISILYDLNKVARISTAEFGLLANRE
jgi:hypothetical protein